jgi:hypothetical protein
MTTYLKEKTETMAELICLTHPDPFNQSQARLFGLTAEDLVLGCESHGDVYDLLCSYESTKLAQESDYLVLSTCGWAKPISDDEEDDEIAPSQHPARRRVFLLIGFDSKENWSIVRFADETENVVSESGRGALAEAVKDLMDRANAKGN